MADTCMCLSSFLNDGHLYCRGCGWKMKTGDTQMCRCSRAGRHTDEDRGDFSVVNGITGSWRVR